MYFELILINGSEKLTKLYLARVKISLFKLSDILAFAFIWK